MRLSRKSEYACLALIELCSNPEQLLKIEEISKKRMIPKKYLEQILLLLKGAGYLKSIRGANGGYGLLKAPEDITIAEIVRLIDGPIAPVASVSKYYYSDTPIGNNRKLKQLFKEIRDYVAEKLENTTFKDMRGE